MHRFVCNYVFVFLQPKFVASLGLKLNGKRISYQMASTGIKRTPKQQQCLSMKGYKLCFLSVNSILIVLKKNMWQAYTPISFFLLFYFHYCKLYIFIIVQTYLNAYGHCVTVFQPINAKCSVRCKISNDHPEINYIFLHHST